MTSTSPEPVPTEALIRPPQQQRSREAWRRVLDAGVAILEVGGFDAFTIAEVCRRAQVAPPAIYARTKTKEALFLAVYEHGIERLRSDMGGLAWVVSGAAPAAESVRLLVVQVARLLLRHRQFLAAVVLISSSHSEVRRRGSGYSQELGNQFAAALRPMGAQLTHDDADAAARSCFNIVFAATVFRIAYGPDFATDGAADDDVFVVELSEVAVRYLLSPVPGQ